MINDTRITEALAMVKDRGTAGFFICEFGIYCLDIPEDDKNNYLDILQTFEPQHARCKFWAYIVWRCLDGWRVRANGEGKGFAFRSKDGKEGVEINAIQAEWARHVIEIVDAMKGKRPNDLRSRVQRRRAELQNKV